MDQKRPEPPKILDKMSMATMTSPIVFWSHILKLKAGYFVVDLCNTVCLFSTSTDLTPFYSVLVGFFPITVECHRSMMVIIATRPKLCNTIYIWHKHNTIMEDLGVIVYLLLHCGGFSDSRTTVFIFVLPFTSLQSFKNGSSSSFLFFSSLSWKSNFHDSSSNAIIDWPNGGLQSFDVTFSYLVPSAPPDGNSKSQPSRY